MASIKETRDAIKALPGMTAMHADGEWRVTVNLYRLSERYPDKNTAWCEEKQEAMAYYTDDAEDALMTAKSMSTAWEADALKGHAAGVSVNEAGLTERQQWAIDTFRASKGRNWKSALRANWERASYPGINADDAAALQQVRNTLGPEWLNKYRPTEAQDNAKQRQYLFLTLEDTTTAAFEDLGHSVEIKRILVETAHKIAVDGFGDGFLLNDLNGNVVGRVEPHADSMIEPLELPPGGVRIGLELHSPALAEGHDQAMEVCAAILTASSKIGEVGTGTHVLLRNERGICGALGVSLLPDRVLKPEAACRSLGSGGDALEP